ncbi:hypothetical protein D3C83_35280 [compost metagenome]
MSSSGSIAPASVVPAVATTSVRTPPPERSAARSAAGSIRWPASTGRRVTAASPRPRIPAERGIEKWAASEQSTRSRLGGRRSRAKSSPIRFEAVPPEVITPPASGP